MPVDQPRVAAAVRELLIAIGENPDSEGLKETPYRVARAYAEMFEGLDQTASDVLSTTFDIAHDEMVLVKNIEVWSTCEHHLVPFTGLAHVGYIPAAQGRITGLSKIARLVDVFAKRPQVQERLTTQIADALMEHLDPRGALVVVEAEHMCMRMRGVRKQSPVMRTVAARGVLESDPRMRLETLALLGVAAPEGAGRALPLAPWSAPGRGAVDRLD